VNERWRQPATVFDVVEDNTVSRTPDGRLRNEAQISVDDETIGRMKAGYLCANCLEPHEVPFPVMCALCGYPMRERQLHDLATRPGSLKAVSVGSRINKEDEFARMNEHYEYEKRTGIILPDAVKFPTGRL
jgi:hypothetical protein